MSGRRHEESGEHPIETDGLQVEAPGLGAAEAEPGVDSHRRTGDRETLAKWGEDTPQPFRPIKSGCCKADTLRGGAKEKDISN